MQACLLRAGVPHDSPLQCGPINVGYCLNLDQFIILLYFNGLAGRQCSPDAVSNGLQSRNNRVRAGYAADSGWEVYAQAAAESPGRGCLGQVGAEESSGSTVVLAREDGDVVAGGWPAGQGNDDIICSVMTDRPPTCT